MYCHRPFSQLYIDEQGDCHLCCPFWIDKPAGNLFQTPLMEIWRGSEATSIRESISDQSFRYCGNCRNRQTIEASPRPYSLDVIDSLTLSYDPSCNLQCPSCRGSSRLPSAKAIEIHRRVLDSGVLEHSRCLTMLGSGDPFASKLTRDLMSQLPQLKHHPQLELCLQTNGILFTPERLTEILSNGLKIRRVLVSIDAATPETYSKLRGGQWNVLMTNICNLREHNIPLQLNFVVQEDNYKEIVAFVELSRNLGALIVYFSALENWGQFSKEEYEKVAVHLRSHPHNKDLHDLLWSLNWWERRSPIINISSLSSLFQKETTCNCP